jgi:hypothetical protein
LEHIYTTKAVDGMRVGIKRHAEQSLALIHATGCAPPRLWTSAAGPPTLVDDLLTINIPGDGFLDISASALPRRNDSARGDEVNGLKRCY